MSIFLRECLYDKVGLVITVVNFCAIKMHVAKFPHIKNRNDIHFSRKLRELTLAHAGRMRGGR